ncbi:unnamed protein product [Mytilus coruscus]|uniref:Uncharacterized protein n=1 Tax=Mytilus coruscus TaxID=42192 RepID=A0A6J8A097_MYTCO|nr:unnamed protein product [Mytilus coruscus]
MLKDADVPRLIHICLRHLELYVECLEMNSLLEIENVTELLTDAYGLFSYESQQASTIQEREIIEALKDVTTRLREIRHGVEGNPDVNEIIKTLLQEYELLNEDSRFLVFVKTRASAKALAKRLPQCLKATHLTGGTKSKDKAVLGKFPNKVDNQTNINRLWKFSKKDDKQQEIKRLGKSPHNDDNQQDIIRVEKFPQKDDNQQEINRLGNFPIMMITNKKSLDWGNFSKKDDNQQEINRLGKFPQKMINNKNQ